MKSPLPLDKPRQRKCFANLVEQAMDKRNWRVTVSSTYRWFVIDIRRDNLCVNAPRYYRTKELAETHGKCSYSMYVVGKVKGFV